VGTDFIEKTKRSFDKHLDRQRAKLATADLFTCEPENMCQTFPGVMASGANLNVGEELTAEVIGNQLILTKGLKVVATVADPPAVIFEAVQQSCGVATAIVQDVHAIAGIVEVTLC
jgi:hypothetical protein